MKALSIVRPPFPAAIHIKPVPVIAVVVDCLIVGAAIFYFTGPHGGQPLASKPEQPTTKVASTSDQVKPKVLGDATVVAAPVTPPAAQPDVVAIITQQTSTTTPLITTPVTEQPSVSDPIASAPVVTDPTTPTTPTDTTPPVGTTPPATPTDPVVPDFTTVITAAGQITPGTLISLNNAKGEKAYYGGDLLLSTSSVTISRATHTLATAPAVTISSPDAAIVNAPTSAASSTTPFIVMDAAAIVNTGTTFNMFVDIGTATPNGTYTLHLTTFRSGQTADAWQYDGFLTVVITD